MCDKRLFRVIDKNTGREPTYEELMKLAMDRESWAGGLVWTDIDDWFISRGGDLMLVDDCGNYAIAPDNYVVVFNDAFENPQFKEYNDGPEST